MPNILEDGEHTGDHFDHRQHLEPGSHDPNTQLLYELCQKERAAAIARSHCPTEDQAPQRLHLTAESIDL